MEPSDFDKLIKGRLEQKSDLYERDSEAAKPRIWNTILDNSTSRSYVLPWYYTAAAAVFLILFSSLLFFKTTEQHKSQLNLLANQIKELENSQSQAELIQLKNEQLDILCSTIDALEEVKSKKLEAPKLTQKVIVQKQIVYQVDTIYLKTKPLEIQQQNVVESISPKIKVDDSKAENEVSYLIYPDYKSSIASPKQDQALLKVIINPFKN